MSAKTKTQPFEHLREVADGPLGPLWMSRILTGVETGRIVGLRRLKRHAGDDDLVADLSEAAFTAMEIRHPKIVAALDIKVSKREVNLAYEHVDGEVLRLAVRQAFAKRAEIPVDVAVRIACDVAQAASHATTAWGEIVGEDEVPFGGLLPDSVVVAAFGDTLLGDVGIAGVMMKALGGASPDALAYRAPECISGEPATEASDVWSLGVILWELLATRTLFGSGGVIRAARPTEADCDAVKQRVAQAEIKKLSELRAQVPTALSDVVAQMLTRDVAERPSTMKWVADAVACAGVDPASDQAVGAWLTRLCGTRMEMRRRAAQAGVPASPDAAGSKGELITIPPTKDEEPGSASTPLEAVDTARGTDLEPHERTTALPTEGAEPTVPPPTRRGEPDAETLERAGGMEQETDDGPSASLPAAEQQSSPPPMMDIPPPPASIRAFSEAPPPIDGARFEPDAFRASEPAGEPPEVDAFGSPAGDEPNEVRPTDTSPLPATRQQGSRGPLLVAVGIAVVLAAVAFVVFGGAPAVDENDAAGELRDAPVPVASAESAPEVTAAEPAPAPEPSTAPSELDPTASAPSMLPPDAEAAAVPSTVTDVSPPPVAPVQQPTGTPPKRFRPSGI